VADGAGQVVSAGDVRGGADLRVEHEREAGAALLQHGVAASGAGRHPDAQVGVAGGGDAGS